MNKIKNILIAGVGGVGGFFGGKIARAIETNQLDLKVTFLSRGKHLEEIRRNGLILNTTAEKNLICKPYLATDNVKEIEKPDLCLICVKSYDLNDVLLQIKELIGKDTILLPLLNGVDIAERIRKVIQNGILYPACVYVGTHIAEPGVITQNGGNGIILMGNYQKENQSKPAELLELFDKLGIGYQWNSNPYPAIWEKYLFIAAYGLVCGSSNKTLGEVLADEEYQNLLYIILNEMKEIATASGVILPQDIIETTIRKGNNFPFETKTSYHRDLLIPGKKNEGDLFGGTLIKLGAQFGKSTNKIKNLYDRINNLKTNSAV